MKSNDPRLRTHLHPRPASTAEREGRLRRQAETEAREVRAEAIEKDTEIARLAREAKSLRGALDASLDRPAPLYAEHTAEVLFDAGFTQAEIDHLAAERAIHVHAGTDQP